MDLKKASDPETPRYLPDSGMLSLKEIRGIGGKRIVDYDNFYDVTDNFKIYVQPEKPSVLTSPEHCGFHFAIVQYGADEKHPSTNWRNSDEGNIMEVDLICSGSARWGGIRIMSFGVPDEALEFPNVAGMGLALIKLAEIEKELCSGVK